MSSDPSIRVEGLGKRYEIYANPRDRLRQTLWGGRRNFYDEFWALRNVSFEVQKGGVVGVIGANGSGKSTLLQLICGTLTPTEGYCLTKGRFAALLELGSGFNFEFTGRENIFLSGAILGFSERQMRERFPEIVEFAGIGDFIDRPVKTYSKGMMMRLAFSVAACIEPEVLLLDEALAVGDASFQIRCIDRLERMTKAGTTLVIVSHDLKLIKAYCDHVLYLNQGRVGIFGSPDEAVEMYQNDLRKSWGGWHRRVLEPKAAQGDLNGIAVFGTTAARIINSEFEGGGVYLVAATGDRVRFSLEADFDSSVRNPAVTFLITDRRKITLGGQTIEIPAAGRSEERCRYRVTAEWRPPLSCGRYYVACRLEDRRSERLWEPLERQDTLLSFDIVSTSDDRAFFGPVDLNIDLGVVKEAGETKSS